MLFALAHVLFFQDLNDGILVMDGLEKLNVSQNKIIKLPSPIGSLSSLSDLDISYNEIRELPADFGKLKLKRFGFAGNKLKVEFKSFCSKRSKFSKGASSCCVAMHGNLLAECSRQSACGACARSFSFGDADTLGSGQQSVARARSRHWQARASRV